MIRDITTYNLITCDINTSIEDICNKMYQHNIGIIPITDNNKIVGIITDRDIVIRGFNKELKDIITYNVISIDVNDSIDKALNLLKENKIKRLLVKDKDIYIGIISISDIIKSDHDKIKIIDAIKTIFSVTPDNSGVEVDTFYL